VPLWVVLWRCLQVGRWTELAPTDLNAVWTPPPALEREIAPPVLVHHGVGPRDKTIWLGLGAVSLALCAGASVGPRDVDRLNSGRLEAADIARRALEGRGVTLGPHWRILPVPDDGRQGPHEFVAETAGNERRKQLLGVYLPAPRWNVRIATFEGDVAERAEEWRIFVTATGQVLRIEHTLPEARPGASLDESAARLRAQAALVQQVGLDVAKGQAREVSARPAKLKARTDWTFVFADVSLAALPRGELRIDVVLAGDEVASIRRYVYVPEQWERRQRAAETRNLILRIVTGIVFGGLLVSAAVAGVIAWSRARYAPRLFLAAAGFMLIASVIAAANAWPRTLALLPTALPLPVQLLGVIGLGLVALTITSSLVGLAIGAQPPRLMASGTLSERDALQLGVAVGLFGAAVSAGAAWLRTPAWAETADITAMGTYLPVLGMAIDPVPGFHTRMAVVFSVLVSISLATLGWTRRRAVAAVALVVVGFLSAGGPIGSHLSGWLAAGLLMAVGLLVAYAVLLRADLTMVPIGLGTMMAIAALARGAQRPFPGALPGSIVAAVLIGLVAWWWFRALRRARATG